MKFTQYLNAPGTRLGANVQRVFENYSKSDPLQFGGENPTAAALEVARMATNLGGDAASLFLRGIGGLIPSARDIEINNPFGEGVVNIGTIPISKSIDDLEVSRDRLAEARASNIPGVSEPSVIETTYQLKPGVTADDIREFADLNPAIKALQEEEEKRQEDINRITDLDDPEPAPIDETKVISTPEVVDPRFVIDDEAKDLEEIAKTTFQEPGAINIRRRQGGNRRS